MFERISGYRRTKKAAMGLEGMQRHERHENSLPSLRFSFRTVSVELKGCVISEMELVCAPRFVEDKKGDQSWFYRDRARLFFSL